MTRPTRRALLAGGSLGAITILVGCSDDAGDSSTTDGGTAPDDDSQAAASVLIPATPRESTSISGDGPALAAAVSALLLESSRVVIIAPEDDASMETANVLAHEGHWPVLVRAESAELPEATAAELTRLGAEHVIVIEPAQTADASPAATATATGTAATSDTDPATDTATATSGPLPELTGLGDVEIHTVHAGAATLPDGVPVGVPPEGVSAAVIADPGAAVSAAVATASALGDPTHTDQSDPREDEATFAALRESPETPLVALAQDEAAAERLLTMATMAQQAPELPGGGVTCFPHRRLVALYGHPGSPVLGLLGEQGVQASIERVDQYVQNYQPLVEETMIPAFEIIASVATAAAGPDNSYSHMWPVETFREWVDAAKEAGVYVVLDLQPGRTDFLTQAKFYEELLIEPHVGLALDPEWRLGPDERHLVRIGSVEAAEINEVSEWLAGLVREHNLPQKVLTLHQFRLSMIKNRQDVRTDHPELAVVLHADGQGGQGAKQDTWRVLKQDLPENMWLGWKNFYDEDSPMLTPEQTIDQVDPTPWFISYQ